MGEALSCISSVVALAGYPGGAQSWWSSVLVELSPGGSSVLVKFSHDGTQPWWGLVMVELNLVEIKTSVPPRVDDCDTLLLSGWIVSDLSRCRPLASGPPYTSQVSVAPRPVGLLPVLCCCP
jgi:hypothetical protein